MGSYVVWQTGVAPPPPRYKTVTTSSGETFRVKADWQPTGTEVMTPQGGMTMLPPNAVSKPEEKGLAPGTTITTISPKQAEEARKALVVQDDIKKLAQEQQQEQIKEAWRGMTPIERIGVRTHATFSERGFEMTTAALTGDQARAEQIAMEKLVEASKSEPKKYQEKTIIGSVFGTPSGMLGTTMLSGYGAGSVIKIAGETAVKAAPILAKPVQFMAAHPTIIKTSLWGSIGGYEGVKFKGMYEEMKSAGYSDKEIEQKLVEEGMRDVVFLGGFSKGISYGMKEGIPLRYGKVEVSLKSAPEPRELYKGLYVDYDKQASILFGKQEGKWILGTPRFAEQIPKAELAGTIAPVTSLESKVIQRAVALESLEIERIGIFTGIMKKLEFTKPKIKLLPPETKTLYVRGTEATKQFIIKEKGLAYGSYTAEAQMPLLSRRISGDIDTSLNKMMNKIEEMTKEHTKTLSRVGENVRVSPQHASLIEATRPEWPKEWKHAVDIHSALEPGASGSGEAPEGAYGFVFGQKPIKIGDLKVMPISEQILRKGGSSLGISERGVYPEAHRMKDIADFYRYAKVYAPSQAEKIKGVYTEEEWNIIKQFLKDSDKIPEPPTYGKIYVPRSTVATAPPLITGKITSKVETKSPSVTISYKPALMSSSGSKSVSPSASVSYSVPLSISPSVSPSVSPSISSSLSPSISPSYSPLPSISPSYSPSVSPSISVSPSPSLSPSPSPSPSSYSPPYSPPPLYPSPRSSKSPSSYSRRFTTGYDVFVRRLGKFTKVTTRPLTREAAKGYGAYITEQTPAASFYIEPSGTFVEMVSKPSQFRKERYYTKGKLFIEKPKYRINTLGELAGITYKGIEARKKKPMVKLI